jgi:peptide/nickel transport system ATP-binding protein
MSEQTRASLNQSVIEATDITKSFPRNAKGCGTTGKRFVAVDNLSLEIVQNEVVGLVGESGSGKMTLGRCILRLIEPDSGTIRINLPGGTSQVLSNQTQNQLRIYRRHLQIVF